MSEGIICNNPSDTHFHMSPSELNTPVPNTDCMYHRKVSPFSKLSKSVARIDCKDLSVGRVKDRVSKYLDVLRLYCGNLQGDQD